MFQNNFFGLPIVAWGGIILFGLLFVQVLTGLQKIKATPRTHKVLGLLILAFALLHAMAGYLYITGGR